MASDGFAVRIKASATDANEAVAEYAAQYGDVVEFDSRDAAADLAAMFTRSDGNAVAVQTAAPQDGGDVDAYLVSRPDRRTHEPDGSIESGLTFDTTARQYGAIGEALIASYETDPPLLAHYARRDLDRAEDDPLRVEVLRDPPPITVEREGETLEWRPDCGAVARDGRDGRALREYRCEIKTGGGSLERDQLAVMRAAANRFAVLKIQLDVSDLPDSYTARIRRVEPDGEDDAVAGAAVDARLDEFL